jgi:hypothetical protein
LAYLKNNKMSPVFYTGAELGGHLQKLETKISSLETKTRELPPFHLIVGGTVLVFLLYIVGDTILKMKRKTWPASEPLNVKPALVTIGLICLYIFVMGSGILDFRILTFIFMMTLGLFLSNKTVLNKTILIECALIISLGTYYVFTYIVHVDLP